MKLFGNHKKKKNPESSARATQRAVKKAEKKPSKFQSSKVGKKWMRIPGVYRGLILLLLSIMLLSGICAAVYFTVVKPPDITVNRKPTKPTIVTEVDPETGEEIEMETEVPVSHKEGYYNILIAGTDGDGGRTDTIIVARLDTKEHSVALLSVPRDTLIVGNYSVPKINSVYGAGGQGKEGMETLKKYVSGVLGFEVDGYVLVDLDAFIQIVDLVGGVYFDVPQSMYYNDPTQNLYINLAPGYQLLDGKQAMGLVRYRSYAQADIQRISVQQEFLQALAKQCLQIGNVAKIQEFAEILSESLVTDLSIGNMVYFGQELLKCDFDNMEMYTPEGNGVDIRGGSYYALYASSILELVNAHFNPYEEEITRGDLTLLIDYSTAIQRYGSGGSSNSSSSGNQTSEPSDTPSEPEPPAEDPNQTEPTDNSGMVVDPTEPSDGGNEGNTGTTTNPGNPENPANPTDPGNPENPDGTSDPGTTTDPDTTEDPNNSTDPGTETDPGTATDPGESGDAGDGGFIVES